MFPLHLLFCFSFLPSPDFNYNTDGYEGDGAEDGKSQDSSETLPYIDESPTMSPQLCAPQGHDGEAVSPTPPEGLVRAAHARAVVRPGAHELAHTALLHQTNWQMGATQELLGDINHQLNVAGPITHPGTDWSTSPLLQLHFYRRTCKDPFHIFSWASLSVSHPLSLSFFQHVWELSRYSIYVLAAPSRWYIHCCQRCLMTYLGLNTTMTDRCQWLNVEGSANMSLLLWCAFLSFFFFF